MMNGQRRTHLRRRASQAPVAPCRNAYPAFRSDKRAKESIMVRTRLASLALATGLGLVCGCLNLPERPLLGRFSLTGNCCPTGGCEAGCCGAGGEGPILNGLDGIPAPP